MLWWYKVSLFFIVLTQMLFFGLVAYHTSMIGYSWIWYHPEHWIICLLLSIVALGAFIRGAIEDLRNYYTK